MREGPHLPLELVDEIIGFTQYDKQALQACSSVCRAWNSVTRSYVFRRVRIRDENKLSAFETLLQKDSDIGIRVRELTFGPFTPPKTFRAAIRWVARIPRVLPTLLPLLRTIRFERLTDAAEYCDARFFRAFTTFASVTKLILDDSALNIPTLRAFACSLPRLQEFVVLEVVPLMVTVWQSPPLICRPRFTSLVIDFAVQPSTTLTEFIAWFQKSEARYTVRSLELAVKILDVKPVNHLLATIGPHLEHLGLKLQPLFSSSWECDLIKGAVSIAPCRNLQSLRLHIPHTTAMIAFLAEVPTEHLRTLIFHIMLDKTFDAENPYTFFPLAAEIDRERYWQISTVRFVHDGTFINLAEVRRGLQKAFASLHARGVLQFTAL